ncbi:MAG TPA: DUF6799 domain-containing protein [Anaerolineales bacterium]
MEMQEDSAIMQDGRVMIMKNGELIPMKQGMTTTDGTRIMPDGTLRMADGTTRMMEEGEMMIIAGEVPDMNEMPDRGSQSDEI